jgi:hypothetical protein
VTFRSKPHDVQIRESRSGGRYLLRPHLIVLLGNVWAYADKQILRFGPESALELADGVRHYAIERAAATGVGDPDCAIDRVPDNDRLTICYQNAEGNARAIGDQRVGSGQPTHRFCVAWVAGPVQ